MGRPRNARHRRRDRVDSAARARLRIVHALHRGVSDRCIGRAGNARLDTLPVVLDTGAGAVALGNTGRGDHRTLLEPYLDSDDELLREQAEWAAARIDDRVRDSAPDA